MTLCCAWINKASNGNEYDELVFATDSCLSWWERWNTGAKLFELPRKDCLICFAGWTHRAYPLILNLISSIKWDKNLQNENIDIEEVLDHITELFSNLIAEIDFTWHSSPPTLESEFKDVFFLFGWWSWKNRSFKIWKISYSDSTKWFIHTEKQLENTWFDHIWIGDSVEKVEESLDEFMKEKYKHWTPIGMKPLKILADAIINTDKDYSWIDGAIQLGKIYQSWVNELFGTIHPKTKKPTYLWKEYPNIKKPEVNYVDIESWSINLIIPNEMESIEEDKFWDYYQFMCDCYPEMIDDDWNTKRELKDDISEREKIDIQKIMKEIVYNDYLKEKEEEHNSEK